MNTNTYTNTRTRAELVYYYQSIKTSVSRDSCFRFTLMNVDQLHTDTPPINHGPYCLMTYEAACAVTNHSNSVNGINVPDIVLSTVITHNN